MLNEIGELLERYNAWLKDKTVLRQTEDWVEITTPYLDRHNDYMQIYAKKENGGFLLTDDGEVIDDLKLCGCKLDTAKRQSLLKTTLNGFGIQIDGDKLVARASKENFALKKHSLIQAMLAINDLFYLAQPIVESVFCEDVAAWLDLQEIRYTPKVKFSGKIGFDHLFDFVIPKSKQQPERILKTINKPTREEAQSIAFAWIDTKEVRPPDSRAYAFLNDSERCIPSSLLEALHNYDIKSVVWSQREKVREELAA
ncbi:MAG: DUF1829 domain-containing protein [Candidatus Omnitrophota bacterium]